MLSSASVGPVYSLFLETVYFLARMHTDHRQGKLLVSGHIYSNSLIIYPNDWSEYWLHLLAWRKLEVHSLRIVLYSAFSVFSLVAIIFLILKVHSFAIYFIRIKWDSSNTEFLIIIVKYFKLSHMIFFFLE